MLPSAPFMALGLVVVLWRVLPLVPSFSSRSGCMIGAMEGPTFDVLGFLDEPRRPASVATVTALGRPALAMMWFLVEDERLWFHSPEGPGVPAPFNRAAREGALVAVMVATFDPPGDVRQVRMTGPSRLEARDDERVRRIYRRYLDGWTARWERQATSAGYRLWSMSPERGMAVAYPGLRDGPAFRWAGPSELFGARWALPPRRGRRPSTGSRRGR
jgi:hypothetical protein